MKRAHVLFSFLSVLLLAALSLAQQPANNPQDRTANPNDQAYNRPVETGHGWGGWGLLGLLGLGGLMGRRRETTITGTGTDTGYGRDDRTYEEQRRRRVG
jgi:MYXO-CTERM domain-containing protein